MLHADGDLRGRTFTFARRIARLFGALPGSRLSEIYGRQLIAVFVTLTKKRR